MGSASAISANIGRYCRHQSSATELGLVPRSLVTAPISEWRVIQALGTRPALERSATPAEIVELKKYRRSMPDGVVPPRARRRNRSWDTRKSDSKLPSRS